MPFSAFTARARLFPSLALLAVGYSEPSLAQALDLRQTVTAAIEHYPSVRVPEAQLQSAAASIQLARTAYLPKVDAVAGVNRATRNNVLGLLLPSQIIAPISGPVLNTNSLGSAWGSTVGALVTWEPFDFGQRAASVAVAEAGRTRAAVAVERARLELAVTAADAALTLLAAQETVTAAEAAVQRANELQRIVDGLVNAELRPGAESSLARAEQAAAQAQVLRARQAVAESRAVLSGLTGIDAAAIQIDATRMLSTIAAPPQPASVDSNPITRDQDAAIAESRARLHVLERSYYPHFALQGTVYARGTGAVPDGRLLGGVNGLGPNIQNWGVGFTATYPLMDLPSIRARRAVENGRLQAESGRRAQVQAELQTRRATAMAAFEGAIGIAGTSAAAIDAARAAVQQTRARYQSGLGTALEVADAQRRLAQAEIDDRLARLNTWRARLAVHAAEGDIGPLLTEAAR